MSALAQTGGGVLEYSNTGANLPFPIGINRLIADDIFLSGQCDCDLNRFEFTVTGGGDGSGPGFTVDYAIYSGCPDTGGSIIPGTAGSVSLPDDGTHVVVVDHAGESLLIPAAFWLGVQSSDPGVSWLTGVAPEFGFSADRYHYPGFGCQAVFGGTTAPYASFAARVYCDPLPGPFVEAPIPADGASGVNTLTTVLTWNGVGTAATAGAGSVDEPVERITPATFVDGTEAPNEFLRTWQAAIAGGEVPDPAQKILPKRAPRVAFGGVAGATVPQVTASDIFAFEDTNDLLATTNFSQGTLFNLMSSATNAVTAAFGDNFDFVGFFLNFTPHHTVGAAFYLGIENDVSGLGQDLGLFNNRQGFGIAGDNIEGWVMMWNQASWETGYFTFTQEVLGQEFEHRFGMFLNPLPGNRSLQGVNGQCGRGFHWNFRVDGQGSGMEIAEWVGSSPAIRQGGALNFNTDIPGGVYSYPDLYLWGYVSPLEMDAGASELRYMDNSNCVSNYTAPISTWSSSDIEATNGVRTPGSFLAQKHFRTAWVMIHRPGPQNLPNPTQLAHTVSILNTWNEVFITSTLGRGTMSNVLHPVDQPAPCDTRYDVLFGPDNPPTNPVCQGIVEPMCDPGPLNPDTQYFWQVTATRLKDITPGPVWTFDTFCNIAASDPPNCAIDARQPYAIDDSSVAQGWDSVALTFQCATASALPEDFAVSVETGAPPTITNVVLSGNTATLQLSRPIPPGQWTCITHLASGSQTCLAALPSDVNGDRTGAPADVLAVIDSLNGVTPLPTYATDVDRSGTSGPEDILRVIDLLNGAGQFTPWLDATIGVCPSSP